LNRKLRRELNQLKDTKEIVEMMRNEAKELLELVKTGSSDELSDRLIEISERLSDLRLKEMKARRKAGLAKESKEYYNKLHIKDQDAI